MRNIVRVSGGSLIPEKGKAVDVGTFSQLSKVAVERAKQARLIFGLDLTASREHTLEQARKATTSMFEGIKNIGSLMMKFIYYRGDECKASKWQNDPDSLAGAMQRLGCIGGITQIGRILNQAINETSVDKVAAIVFVGDHCEEHPDDLITLANTLKSKSTPVFIFHECADNDQASLDARPTFKRISEVTGGAYCQFNSNSGLVLQELLLNIAAFSTGGLDGIKHIGQPKTPEAKKLQGRLLALAPPK